MTTALALLVLAAATVVVLRRLHVNHHRVTAWPVDDDRTDRDVARVRADLAAARSTTAAAAAPARLVQPAAVGRRTAPPTVRAA